MSEPVLIDEKDRAPGLKEFIFVQAETLSRIKMAQKRFVPETINTPFLYRLYPWFEEMHAADSKELLADRRKQFEDAGFDGESIRQSLVDILKSDKHLRECCVLPGPLAHCLDLGFISTAASLLLANAPQTRLDELYEQFVLTIYVRVPHKPL